MGTTSILFFSREGLGHAGFEKRTLPLCESLKLPPHTISYLSLCSQLSKPQWKYNLWNWIQVNYLAFRKLIQKKPQLIVLQRVHFHLPSFWLYRTIYRTPFILDIDDWEFKENLKVWHNISNSIFENLTTHLCKKARNIVVSSNWLKEHFFQRTKLLPQVIPTGTVPPKSLTRSKTKSILWIGSVDRHDTLEELKHILQLSPKLLHQNIKIQIIARGQYIKNLQQTIHQLNHPNLKLHIDPPKTITSKLLEEASLGWLPLFSNTKFNLSKSPVKLFDYLHYNILPLATTLGEAQIILPQELLSETADQMVEKSLIYIIKETKETQAIVEKIKQNWKYYRISNCLPKWEKALKLALER